MKRIKEFIIQIKMQPIRLPNILLNRKLKMQQMHFICQQLSFALAGGMSLPNALQLVGNEIRPVICSQFLLQISEQVQQGQTMAQAMQNSKIRYSPVLLEFVMAGEQNGTMQEAMEQAADYFQQQNRTKQMLTSALFYPAILCVLMIVAFGAMFLFVVPTVIQTYDNFDAPLPKTTQIVLKISEWMQQQWLLILVLVFLLLILSVIIWRRLRAIPTWCDFIKKFLLRIPLVGKLYQQYWFVQIGQAMGLMLSSGMLLSSCLQAVQQIYHRSLFAQDLEQCNKAFMEGYAFDAALQKCSFIPSMARQMLNVSEQSGALATALLQLSRYYQQQVQQKLHRLVGLLEPCFVILLGFGILLMTGSLFLPLVQSYQYLL